MQGVHRAVTRIANGFCHFAANAALRKRLRLLTGLRWTALSCVCLPRTAARWHSKWHSAQPLCAVVLGEIFSRRAPTHRSRSDAVGRYFASRYKRRAREVLGPCQFGPRQCRLADLFEKRGELLVEKCESCSGNLGATFAAAERSMEERLALGIQPSAKLSKLQTFRSALGFPSAPLDFC